MTSPSTNLEAVMPAHESSDYFDLQHHGCMPVSCGLLLPPDLTLENWAAVGRALGRQQHAVQWRIGDWWNHPGHAYGDRLTLVTEDDWTGPPTAPAPMQPPSPADLKLPDVGNF